MAAADWHPTHLYVVVSGRAGIQSVLSCSTTCRSHWAALIDTFATRMCALVSTDGPIDKGPEEEDSLKAELKPSGHSWLEVVGAQANCAPAI